MSRSLLAVTALLAPFALAACVDSPPPGPRVVVQTPPGPPQPAPIPMTSPAPPPPAHSELVPPPPQGAGNVVWQPGHWRYTGVPGNPWSWQGGLYVQPPPGQSIWRPGRWMQQPGSGWRWVEGHWA